MTSVYGVTSKSGMSSGSNIGETSEEFGVDLLGEIEVELILRVAFQEVESFLREGREGITPFELRECVSQEVHFTL